MELFNIKPDYDLDIMKERQTLTGITMRVLEGMEKVLDEVKPDIVLVHGDTTTSFVAALAAFYKQIKVGHVEAGLRTTVIDAIKHTIEENYVFTIDELNHIDYSKKRVITMTAHRRENLGKPLQNICEAVKRVVLENQDVEVVYAVHKNPAVREVAVEILGHLDRVHLVEPLDLKDMHNLMKRSYLVMTDSGGLQEEVPSLGKPVLVLRNVVTVQSLT